MKNISKSKFKKQSQIFNLKTILNNVKNESYLLMSKITELQKIFKTTKKIINEKINELAKNKNNKLNGNEIEAELKHQICDKLNIIINRYKEGKAITSINNKKHENKRKIIEKTKQLNLILKKLKYEKLQNEKDLLIQTIKEKNSICDDFKKQIEYEKDLGRIFQPRNLIFFDNLFFVKNKYLKMHLEKSKRKKINELLNHSSINLEEKGILSVNKLKEEKRNYIKKYNEYISDKGFNYKFENKKHKERYNIEIELLNNYECSSDSDYDIDEEETNNKITFLNNYIYENNVDNVNNINILNNNNNGIKKNKKRKVSLSSSEKDTNDQEKEIKNNDNIILVNKLVELKEKYNRLINEKYDLDYKKKQIQKKITNIKYTIEKNQFTSASLSINKKYFKSLSTLSAGGLPTLLSHKGSCSVLPGMTSLSLTLKKRSVI